MEVKVVIGSNYGDEGKGLVSGNLARNAFKEYKKTLTVFYNGTIQRCHSFGDTMFHCEATGSIYGSDTYYHQMFVVDPIALWLTDTKVYIDPNCRLILPCDVAANRKAEISRGDNRHGSCGLGLFAAVSREKQIYAKELLDPWTFYQHITEIGTDECDMVYNLDNYMRAAAYITSSCKIATFDEIKNNYDVIIYEGGQGLLLDQSNKDDFPHLTPSSVGLYNIANDIAKLNCIPELYYVSRTYMTRHGAGPMESECMKDEINPDIVDTVNQPNPWQGSLRFGRIDMNTLYKRIKKDAATYNKDSKINLVFTQLNYTDNKIETIEGCKEIIKPDFCSKLFISNDKSYIYEKE